MFTNGFEKIAIIAPAIGYARGTAARLGKGLKKGVTELVESQREKGIKAYRAAKGSTAKGVGEGLYNTRAARLAEKGKTPGFSELSKMPGQAKKDVYSRAKQMEESKAARKKSFASKHPFLTAGGLYLGARAAFGGNDDKQSQSQPQVSPPQY